MATRVPRQARSLFMPMSASATARLTNTPADFHNGRVFRAYDSKYNIIDAQVVNDSEPEVVLESLFQNPETAFVDVRSVTHGCFTFRVQRA